MWCESSYPSKIPIRDHGFNFVQIMNRPIVSTLVSLLVFLLLLLIFFASASRTRLHNAVSADNNSTALITQACRASRDPPRCAASLAQSEHAPPPNATILDVIESARWASLEKLDAAADMIAALQNTTTNLNVTMAARGCLKGLAADKARAGPTFEALRSGRLKDARAWTSNAGSTEFGCAAGLANVARDSRTNETAAFVGGLAGITANALGMMVNLDNFGEQYESWGPVQTERDGFWERLSVDGNGFDFSGGVPRDLTANVTVCKGGGGCDYGAVQEAVNAAPEEGGGRFVIWIKEGIYEEIVGVPFSKSNVVFLGDGMGKTVITGSLNVGMPGVSTLFSATLAVEGDGFMCSNMTIQNTAGAGAHQAVAFRSESDLSVIENCEFIGNQDTLYVHSLRQYYKSCRIQGNVDFIFGNAAAFFQDCTVLIAPRQANATAGETNTVTAQGRTDPAQSTGFVFYNCLVNATEEYARLQKSQPKLHRSYLGRPWKEFSRTVFINSTMESVIAPEGWLPWAGDSALATLYYGELANAGLGANLSARVPWSSRIPEQRVQAYTASNFIQGGDWITRI